MAEEKDPFEILKSKLEARKKQHDQAPPGNPAARAPAPTPAPPRPAAPRGPAGGAAPSAAPRKVRPVAPVSKAVPPAREKPGEIAAPIKIIRTSWSAEDLKKMENSREQVGKVIPSKFVSHRFDCELDARNKARLEKEKAASPPEKPKKFTSDRFDR